MKIVAHMLIYNEADIIEETLCEIIRWGYMPEIVILDGGSNDGTVGKVRAFDGADIDLTVSPDPGGKFADHRRMELLRLTRRHSPDWIISLDADEIYHTSPIDAIMAAEEEGEGANVVWCDVPQFWITFADVKAGLLLEDAEVEYRSIQERRRWYSWGHTGVFIWKDDPAHVYPPDVPKRTPDKAGVRDFRDWQKPGPVRAICKHYPFRTLTQSIERQRARLERGGRKYFGKYALDWIIDEYAAQLHYFIGQWDTRCNHDSVVNYMGRFENE